MASNPRQERIRKRRTNAAYGDVFCLPLKSQDRDRSNEEFLLAVVFVH